MILVEEEKERLLLVGVSEQDGDDARDSIEELEDLVKTSGAIPVGSLIQNRERMHPGTYVGKGKIEEIRALAEEKEATGVVCDDELTPAQLRNLSDMLELKVMDRTLVILDIFAARASTSEGKIQVELAQVQRHREVTREQRVRNKVPVAAIVGYTNAGKSTLLNALTDAGVKEEDQLFATLDPTTRMLELSGKQQILLTDTVGFIRKLPHHLVEAFQSTLEEAKYADYILHVVDASNPQADKQMHIVYETLRRLGVEDKKIVTLFNKQDKREEDEPLHDFRADHTLSVSAKFGDGLEQLKALLEELLREDKILIERVIPYQEAGILQLVRKQGELLLEEYQPEGIFVRAYVPREVYGKLPMEGSLLL